MAFMMTLLLSRDKIPSSLETTSVPLPSSPFSLAIIVDTCVVYKRVDSADEDLDFDFFYFYF